MYQLLIISLVIILIIAGGIAMTYPNLVLFSQSAWYVFFLILTPLSIFLTVILWISTLQSQQRDMSHHDRDSLSVVQEQILRVERELVSSSSICPRFVKSLVQESKEESTFSEGELREKLQIQYLSDLIFSTIELYVHEKKHCPVDQARFGQWFKSKILREEWIKRHKLYSPKVSCLVHHLVSS